MSELDEDAHEYLLQHQYCDWEENEERAENTIEAMKKCSDIHLSLFKKMLNRITTTLSSNAAPPKMNSQ